MSADEQPHNMDTPEKKAKRIRVRTEEARRILLHDRIENPIFEIVINSGRAGRYVADNWYARCRFAMYKNGETLADNAKWEKYLKEITDWPSMLWAGLMDNETNVRQAKTVYGRLGRLAQTTHNTDGTVTISTAGWAPRLLGFSEIEILAWLGVIGGEKPPAVVEESE